MADLRDWIVGAEITTARLNAVNEAAREGRYSANPGGGVESSRTPSGSTDRRKGPSEIWVRITALGSGGAYGGTQAMESSAAGGWADGPRVFTAASGRLREANGSITVPVSGSIRVRAFRDNFNWRFVYGAC